MIFSHTLRSTTIVFLEKGIERIIPSELYSPEMILKRVTQLKARERQRSSIISEAENSKDKMECVSSRVVFKKVET